jgi:cytochrome c553
MKTIYQLPNLKLKSNTNLLTEDAFEQESNRLLETYFDPDSAIQYNDELVKACSACHGSDGIGTSDEYPNIGGQNELYLFNALRDYQTGARQSSKMQAMIKNLSEMQLKKLAAHYAKMVRGYKPE